MALPHPSSRRLWRWLPVIIWLVVIYLFSAQTGEQSGALSGGITETLVEHLVPHYTELPPAEQATVLSNWHFYVRKAAHFSEYAVLGVLLSAALAAYPLRTPLRLLLSAGGGLLWAAGDELHQLFVAARGPSVRDVLIDFGGALFGSLIAVAVTAWWRRKRNKPARS